MLYVLGLIFSIFVQTIVGLVFGIVFFAIFFAILYIFEILDPCTGPDEE